MRWPSLSRRRVGRGSWPSRAGPAHRPNVLAAAAAGKHILLEKPMALSVDECTAMNEACGAAGVKLSLAKISRWLEAVKVGHDLVADGAAGELVALHVHRFFPGY